MAGSDPALRQKIVDKLGACGGCVSGTYDEIQRKLDLESVSGTQFRRALGSLQHRLGTIQRFSHREIGSAALAPTKYTIRLRVFMELA